MADIVEEAVGPDDKTGTACDRAFVTPETGSDLALGQRLLEGFFFDDDDQVADSGFEFCPALVFCEVADTVEVDEDDPSDDEEFDL